MKTKSLLTFIAFAAVLLTAGCKKDTFEETIGECPVVWATNPEAGDNDVSISQNVTITFNKEMNPETINSESITLFGPRNQVAGVVSYSGTTATFNPSSLLEMNTIYTGRVKTLVKDLKGNALQREYAWTFTTGSTMAPRVISTDPSHLETNVELNKVITATFSEDMNASTINTNSFTLKRNGVTEMGGTVSYNGRTATFTPKTSLMAATTYQATITTAAQNSAGTSLNKNYVWTFSTGSTVAPTVISTDPENLEINVLLNKNVTATFSQTMNPSTISAKSFTLTENGNSVAGIITYSGNTATFNPSESFMPNTTYTATIAETAKNLAGTQLENKYIWTFTTSNLSGPGGIDLDCVGRFSVIAGSTVTNTGATIIDGDLGLSPGTSVTGFPPGSVINGSIRINDGPANNGKTCLTTAYNDAAGRSSNVVVLSNGELGGLTLKPGLYKAPAGSFDITNSNLTLDAQGDANAVWIFQMPSSTLTVGNGVRVNLAGGASAKNIYWIVGTSATIGTTAQMKGTIIADQSITLMTGAMLTGRTLAVNGAVTLDNNIVTKP